MSTNETHAVDLDAVRAAERRIRPFIHRTPVMTCRHLDDRAGRRLYLKCENLQRVGAFKIRGATNAVQKLPADVAARGVVTHSSGNHAQALALAARTRGIPAHIVMPSNAPQVKKDAVAGYGGRIIECAATLEARETTAQRVVDETGGTLIHPYDHPDIIAGQGTMALELLEDVPDLDAIIAPVGGGGMMSGICVAARGLRPQLRLFAAEPRGADDAARSFAAGERIEQTAPDTIADGLLTSLGELTWPILRDHLEAVVTVEESEIREAMRAVMQFAKLMVEPSGAVGVAAALGGSFRKVDRLQKVGVILCGGNVDPAKLSALLTGP